MLDTKNMQKKVRGAFKDVKATHYNLNLPVAYTEKDRTLNLYKDGSVADVTERYKEKIEEISYEN